MSKLGTSLTLIPPKPSANVNRIIARLVTPRHIPLLRKYGASHFSGIPILVQAHVELQCMACFLACRT